MSFDLARLASISSLEYSGKRNELYGARAGYNTYIRYFKNEYTLVLRIYASSHDKSIRPALTAFTAAHKGYSFVRAWDNRVTAMLTIEKSDSEEAVLAEIDALFGLIGSYGLIPCCSMCGENKPTAMYEMTIDNANLCSDCLPVLSADIEKSNRLFASQRPRLVPALIACLIAGAITFFYANFSSGDLPEVWNGMLVTVVGVILSVFLVKHFVGKATVTVALMSVVICILAAMLGTVSWFCSFFADFNRENAEGQQYIIDYCEKVNEGFDPYAEAFHSGDIELAGKYASLDGVTDKKLDEYYRGAKRIVEHQSYSECFKDFTKLMFSSYGEKVVDGFYRLIIGEIAGAVLLALILWRRIIKTDKFRYKLRQLPLNTVNPYDMIVGNNQQR